MQRESENGQRGSIILESTYCILATIIVLIFFLSFGFFLYQKTMIKIVANEVAEEVTQTYKLRYVSDSSDIESRDISGIGKYRYLFFTDSFNEKNEIKVKNLSNARLTKTSLAKKEGTLYTEVETVVDDIGRRHYVITVRQRYSFLLGDLLEIIGQEGVQELEVVSYVESADVLNYINTVKMTKYGIDKVKDNESFQGAVDSAISLLKSVFDN